MISGTFGAPEAAALQGGKESECKKYRETSSKISEISVKSEEFAVIITRITLVASEHLLNTLTAWNITFPLPLLETFHLLLVFLRLFFLQPHSLFQLLTHLPFSSNLLQNLSIFILLEAVYIETREKEKKSEVKKRQCRCSMLTQSRASYIR